jgi:uncharacterized protein (UPF0276 family)
VNDAAAPRFAALPASPAGAGIGLRSVHYADFQQQRPRVPLIEVHSENMFRGGRHLDVLLQVRRDTAVSLHGVGLSLGSTDPLSAPHLAALRTLVRRVEPALVSDHLCWSSVGGVYANDLLPLPCTREALLHVVHRVEQVQEALGRRLLVENVSSYLQFEGADMSEWEFVAEVARRSGCALLLDVNNVHVSATNHGFDAVDYLEAVPTGAVAEFHLAGYSVNRVTGEDGCERELLIDSHSRPVTDAVWSLYEAALRRFGPRPTIVEWDAELPSLAGLLAEAAQAQRRLDACAAQEGRSRHAALA